MNIRTTLISALTALVLLSGCSSPDVDIMTQSLAKQNSWSVDNAACYANELSNVMETEHYNFLAKLMSKGMSMKDANTRVRRKFGTSYVTKLKTNSVLSSCIAS